MGYTKTEADQLRATGMPIVACFFCLHDEGVARPYFRPSDTEMFGGLIACKPHFDTEGFGKVEVGPWVRI